MKAAELIAHLRQVQPQARVEFYINDGSSEGIQLGLPVDKIGKYFTTAALTQPVPDVFNVEFAGRWWSGGDVQAMRDSLRDLLEVLDSSGVGEAAYYGAGYKDLQDCIDRAKVLLGDL